MDWRAIYVGDCHTNLGPLVFCCADEVEKLPRIFGSGGSFCFGSMFEVPLLTASAQAINRFLSHLSAADFAYTKDISGTKGGQPYVVQLIYVTVVNSIAYQIWYQWYDILITRLDSRLTPVLLPDRGQAKLVSSYPFVENLIPW